MPTRVISAGQCGGITRSNHLCLREGSAFIRMVVRVLSAVDIIGEERMFGVATRQPGTHSVFQAGHVGHPLGVRVSQCVVHWAVAEGYSHNLLRIDHLLMLVVCTSHVSIRSKSLPGIGLFDTVKYMTYSGTERWYTNRCDRI